MYPHCHSDECSKPKDRENRIESGMAINIRKSFCAFERGNRGLIDENGKADPALTGYQYMGHSIVVASNYLPEQSSNGASRQAWCPW